jgi:hypothetical protein
MKISAKIAALLLVLVLGLAAWKITSLAQNKPAAPKRSFFGGAKPVAATGSRQQGLTATGGTKGLDGKMIGEAQPTAADRAMVGAMENYSIPEADLKQFQDDGKLIPAK